MDRSTEAIALQEDYRKISVKVSVFYEIRDSETYGGAGSVGYACTHVNGNPEMLDNDFKAYISRQKKSFASGFGVSEECVQVITQEEYELNTEENENMEIPEPEQPELPIFRNNDQRREWLRSYKIWGLWYEDTNIGVKYYKYDFDNGARLIAEVYQHPENGIVPDHESCFLHLVGGPEPPKKAGWSFGKWTRHESYCKHPSNETELVEFLKEVQRGQK